VGGVAINAITTAGRKPVYDRVSAYTYCQLEVEKQLKSPSSARFSNMDATGVDGEWTATGSVDSENSFGAMVRAEYGCTITGGDRIKVDYIR
jgi:hypothetical protein